MSERPIDRSEVILQARIIGGIQMIDGGEADDKIVAVLAQDKVWADAHDLEDVPKSMVDRIVHYFSTYKLIPGEESTVRIPRVYDAEHARRVVVAAMEDYEEAFGGDQR